MCAQLVCYCFYLVLVFVFVEGHVECVYLFSTVCCVTVVLWMRGEGEKGEVDNEVRWFAQWARVCASTTSFQCKLESTNVNDVASESVGGR